jgi:hypothetical protein
MLIRRADRPHVRRSLQRQKGSVSVYVYEECDDGRLRTHRTAASSTALLGALTLALASCGGQAHSEHLTSDAYL